MLITPILGTISSKESRDYVDTVTAVAAYAWHVEILTNIYYMRTASNASESGDVLSEEMYETGANGWSVHGYIHCECGRKWQRAHSMTRRYEMHRAGGTWWRLPSLQRLSACLSNPSRSPPPRTVYDEAGDGATAVSIVVMATKAVGAMRNLRSQIEIATENRGVMPQSSSKRVRFARRGGNRGAGREEGDDAIGRRSPICPVYRVVC